MINRSTISRNHAAEGGGIFSAGSSIIINSTISGNQADNYDGGILAYNNRVVLANSTVAHNVADADRDGTGVGGGVFVDSNTVVKPRNTIIAGNTNIGIGRRSPDCNGRLYQSVGYNLIGNTTGCTLAGDLTGTLVNVNPQLGPLQDNGGPTKTHALQDGSPAIDAANPAVPGSGSGACELKDQRGVPRLQDGDGDGTPRCDMGAYEKETVAQPT